MTLFVCRCCRAHGRYDIRPQRCPGCGQFWGFDEVLTLDDHRFLIMLVLWNEREILSGKIKLGS